MTAIAEVPLTIDGRGRLVSVDSPHSSDPGNFIVFTDLVTDAARRIRKRKGKGGNVGATAGVPITALHEFAHNNAGTITYHKFRTYGTTIQKLNGGTWVTQTITDPDTGSTKTFTGTDWVFLNFDNRCYLVNGVDEMYYFDGTSWYEAGQDAPTLTMTYSLTAVDNPFGTAHSGSGSGTTMTATKGSRAVICSSSVLTTGSTWVGKTIEIDGVRYEIEAVPAANEVTLTEGFKEDSASGLAYTIYVGAGSWNLPPRYAYAFYNPTNGNISNIGPIIQITEQDQVGRTIQLTIPGDAENTRAYRNGYTKIQFFRTAKDGAVLVALNETVNNNNTGTSITYSETSSKFLDTYLTLQRAPLTSNRKPPSGLSALAQYQGRLFGIKPSTDRIHFTPKDYEVPFGIAAQCWPTGEHTRLIPQMKGLLRQGGEYRGNLVIQTTDGDWTLLGYDEGTYVEEPLGNRRAGGFLHGATDVDGALVQFYKDRRLMVFPGGIDLGEDIQNKLDAIKEGLLEGVRLHWFSSKTFNLILLSVPSGSGSTANDRTYVYDLGRQKWYDWNFGVSSFATMHDGASGDLELWAGTPDGYVFILLQDTEWVDLISDFVPVLQTGWIRAAEDVRQRVKYVKIWVSNEAETWTGRLYYDEQTNSGATDGSVVALTFQSAAHEMQSAQGKEMIATIPQGKQRECAAFSLEITFPEDTTDFYIEKIVVGVESDQTVEAQA